MIERHPQITPDNAGSLTPEWARPADITRNFGIKRATLWALMKEGKIKSVSLRKRHQIRGTRLVNIESVRCFIEEQIPGNAVNDISKRECNSQECTATTKAAK